jgi:hypothetical protein
LQTAALPGEASAFCFGLAGGQADDPFRRQVAVFRARDELFTLPAEPLRCEPSVCTRTELKEDRISKLTLTSGFAEFGYSSIVGASQILSPSLCCRQASRPVHQLLKISLI